MAARDLADHDYQTLATVRHELRRFLRFSEAAAKKAGLTAQQYQALLAIRAAPKATMLVGELADRLVVRPHSATELINRLERLDLIARGPAGDDRRQVRVSLTTKACDLLVSLAASHRIELKRLGPQLATLMARL